MVEIYLARHGQTRANRDLLLAGNSDSPLTEKGLAEARQVGSLLKDIPFDRVLVSPLGRAVETARIILAHSCLNLPELEIRAELAELSCGSWQGLHRDEVLEPGTNIRTTWEFQPPQGEGYADGQTRLAPLVKELKADTRSERILIVSHAGINRVFYRLWPGLPREEAMTTFHPHEVVYRFRADGTVGHLSPGRPEGEGLIKDAEPD